MYIIADMSREFADKLFAPFKVEEFPTDLRDVRLLQRLLGSPAVVPIPVPLQYMTTFGQLWMDQEHPLFVSTQQGPTAVDLSLRLAQALKSAWPSGTPSELLYTSYWSSIGFDLPEFAGKLLEFPAIVNRSYNPFNFTQFAHAWVTYVAVSP